MTENNVKCNSSALNPMGKLLFKKFSFTKELFNKNTPMDPESFWERFGVKLYQFKPSLVYYLDNRIQFAFREEVKIGVTKK